MEIERTAEAAMNDGIRPVDVFQTLGLEHRLIFGVLDAFERFVGRLDADAEPNLLELGRFVTFFREFVDLTHHEREEQVLFPVLVEHGFADGYGPLEHIREQHGTEREFLWRLMAGFVECESSSGEALSNLRHVGLAYVHFQRAHITKENKLLYPAARRELSISDLRRLREATARFEAAPHRADKTWLTALGESLVARHG